MAARRLVLGAGRWPLGRADRSERLLRPPSRRRWHHSHGIYRLGPVVYGNDPNPGFHGRYHRLVCGDWWDEDPNSPGVQHLPARSVRGVTTVRRRTASRLWTETTYYPSFAVVEYNVDPVVPYAGSAIFVHADTGTHDWLREHPAARARQVPEVARLGSATDHSHGPGQRVGQLLNLRLPSGRDRR